MLQPFTRDRECRKNIDSRLEIIDPSRQTFLGGDLLVTCQSSFCNDSFKTVLLIHWILRISLDLLKYLGIIFCIPVL